MHVPAPLSAKGQYRLRGFFDLSPLSCQIRLNLKCEGNGLCQIDTLVRTRRGKTRKERKLGYNVYLTARPTIAIYDRARTKAKRRGKNAGEELTNKSLPLGTLRSVRQALSGRVMCHENLPNAFQALLQLVRALRHGGSLSENTAGRQLRFRRNPLP